MVFPHVSVMNMALRDVCLLIYCPPVSVIKVNDLTEEYVKYVNFNVIQFISEIQYFFHILYLQIENFCL